MFEIELKNSEEILIHDKDKNVAINIAQSTINADLAVGTIGGAGEFEIGDGDRDIGTNGCQRHAQGGRRQIKERFSRSAHKISSGSVTFVN